MIITLVMTAVCTALATIKTVKSYSKNKLGVTGSVNAAGCIIGCIALLALDSMIWYAGYAFAREQAASAVPVRSTP